MTHWSIRQVFALMLTVFVTLGMSLSVVQANDMADKMTMTSDTMGVFGHGDCHGCDGDAGNTKAMVCTVTCVTAVSAVLPFTGPASLVVAATKLGLSKTALLVGSTSPPEPYPPRSIRIG